MRRERTLLSLMLFGLLAASCNCRGCITDGLEKVDEKLDEASEKIEQAEKNKPTKPNQPKPPPRSRTHDADSD